MFMIYEHRSSNLKFDNFHICLVRFQNLVVFDYVGDVGDIVMMIMSFEKIVVCWEFYHMIFISAFVITSCVVGV